MRYLSVCSGIEAASTAWHPLGWQCAGVAEIEPFPCQVLAQRLGAGRPRYMPDPEAEGLSAKDAKARAAAIKAMGGRHMRWGNELVNFGDFTQIRSDDVGPIDLLVGGTPCQSFSVAGKRLGLDDPRGNLTLEFLALARRVRPRWLVWENVPGVLSHDDGRTFGTFLGLLAECGFERWAYRVLDAQYVRVGRFGRAVPQRRRRVFVVGYSGTADIHPRAVLLDRESLRGNPAPRREAGKGIAGLAHGGATGGGVAEVASTLNAAFGSKLGLEDQHINSGAPFDASEDGTGRGTPLVPIAFAENSRAELRLCGGDGSVSAQLTTGGGKPGQGQPCIAFTCKDYGNDADDAVSPTLRSMGHDGSHANGRGQVAVAFDMRGREGGSVPEGPHHTANIRAASGGSSRSYVAAKWGVRRLMPIECERLQGFPDRWTEIEWRGKPAAECPDGPRYKAVGNSKAINVVTWIGERIAAVDALAGEERAAA